MRDAAGATSSASLTVTVTGANDAPVAVANTASAQEDVTTSATGNVLTNDTDVDTGDTKAVSAVNGVAGNVGASVAGTYGSVVIGSNGAYTYTLNNGSAGVQALGGRPDGHRHLHLYDARCGGRDELDQPHGHGDRHQRCPGRGRQYRLRPGGRHDFVHRQRAYQRYRRRCRRHEGRLRGERSCRQCRRLGRRQRTARSSSARMAPTPTRSTTARAPCSRSSAGQTVTDSFTYTTRDGSGATSSTTLTVTVTGTNDAPVVNSTATPPVYTDTDGDGQYDAGEGNGGFTSGNITNGSSTTTTFVHTRTFDIPANADPSNTRITVDFATLDNSGTIRVNGTSIISIPYLEFENANYDAATDSRVTFADGTVRVQSVGRQHPTACRASKSSSPNCGIEIWGTRTSTSASLERMVLQSGSFVLPNITTGQNTVELVNHDDNGPDGMVGTITVTNDPFQDRSYSETQAVSFSVASGFSDIDTNDTLTYSASGLPQGLSINPTTGFVSGTVANNSARHLHRRLHRQRRKRRHGQRLPSPSPSPAATPRRQAPA